MYNKRGGESVSVREPGRTRTALKTQTTITQTRQQPPRTDLLVGEGGPDVVILGHHRLVRPQDDLGAVLVHLLVVRMGEGVWR